MGIGAVAGLGGRHARLGERFGSPLAGGIPGQTRVTADGLVEQLADGANRVQRGIGILKDHAHGLAPQLTQGLTIQLGQVLAVEPDGLGMKLPRRGHQAEN